MKAIAILIIFCAMAVSASADPTNTLEKFCPHFSSGTQIIWEAPTNRLPHSIWIYRRILPHIFPETVISNAIVLASLQQRGIPTPSTNDYYVPAFYPPPNYPDMIPDIFDIIPNDAFLTYSPPNNLDQELDKYKDIPNNETVVSEALGHVGQLGLNPAKFIRKKFYTDFDVNYQTSTPTTNGIIGHGVFFSRKLDGLMFFTPNDQGDGAEGFFFELGSHRKIRAFSVRWSDVERYQNQAVISPQEIIQCIRAQRVLFLPDPNDDTYFEKIKRMATAKRLVITKITPYYMDGFMGEIPVDNTPCKFIVPLAELDATLDFGNSNVNVHVLSPIIPSDVHRLLGK